MNKEKQKLLEALEIIKDTCLKQDDCDSCPLGYYSGSGTCYLEESPEVWDIKNPMEEEKVWRAYRN